MSFDFSTLITDRTAEDLAKKATKAFYNASDLNRVTACMDYLDGELRRLGYESGYQRVRIERPEPPPTSRLPEGYTELEYIESTGTQCIDTGFKPNQDTRVISDVNWEPSGATSWLFGCRTATSEKTYNFLRANGKYRSDYNNSATGAELSATPSGRFEIDKDKNVTKIDGVVARTLTYAAFQTQYSLVLFANNNAGKIAGNASAKLYSCKVYDNGTLARDFMPCSGPSGTVGLYDRIGEKFYGNVGTGVFFAGPQKRILPKGYTQLEYIESSGTQCIDTGFKPNQDSGIAVDFQALPSNTGSNHHFATANSSNPTAFFAHRLKADRSGFSSRYGTDGLKDIPSNGPLNRHVLVRNRNVISIDGGTEIEGVYRRFQLPCSLYIFAINQDNVVSGYTSLRLYSCKIYNDGVVSKDLFPCRNDDGAIGLYDAIEGRFHTNAGTGDFIAGPEIASGTLPAPPPKPLDPYLWYDTDAPTAPQMAQYLANVAALRAVFTLPSGVPQTPQSMTLLTFAKANDIEQVLQAVESALERMALTFVACGTATVGGDYL